MRMRNNYIRGVVPQRGLSSPLTTFLETPLCLLTHLTYGASVRPEKAVMYSAGKEGLKICGDLPETTAFKSCATKQERKSQYANYSDLPAFSFLRLTRSKAPESTKQLSTTFSFTQNDAY